MPLGLKTDRIIFTAQPSILHNIDEDYEDYETFFGSYFCVFKFSFNFESGEF